MANDLTARPWFIDTASATPIWVSPLIVKFVEVIGGTVAPAVGDLLATLTDQNGKNIIDARAQVAAIREIQTYNLENWFNGLIVPALGPNGVTLRIHVK
jgi:hypothetical protein